MNFNKNLQSQYSFPEPIIQKIGIAAAKRIQINCNNSSLFELRGSRRGKWTILVFLVPFLTQDIVNTIRVKNQIQFADTFPFVR